MKTSRKKTIFLIVLVIILIGIAMYITFDKNSKELKGYVIKSGSISVMENNKFLIKTHKELEQFCENYNRYTYDGQGNRKSGTLDILLKKYDKFSFEEQSLAIVYIGTSSGSASVKFVDATIFENSVNIQTKINYPEIGTMDMSGYMVIVEVPKNITSISHNDN